ncbi:MAG: hypothetical protein ACI4OK_02370, partial [Selenomonas bovis]
EDAEHGEAFFLCGTPPLAVAPCALGWQEAAGRRGFGDESFPLYAGFPCVFIKKRQIFALRAVPYAGGGSLFCCRGLY